MLAFVYTSVAPGQDAAAEATPAPPPAPALQLAVDLTDGSHLIGTPEITSLKMSTSYAAMDIPLPMMSGIDFTRGRKDSNGLAQVTLRNGDAFGARLAAREITMNTLLGKVTIPLDVVGVIRVIATRTGPVAPMPEGLVLRFAFDADEGAKATDSSGAGNDGAVQGATYANEGKIGGAMAFSGKHQAVIVKNAASLQLQNFTIVAWIKRGDKDRYTKPGPMGTGAVIFGFGQSGYGLGFGDDKFLTLSKIGNSGNPSKYQINDDAWHQVAVTKDGNKVVFYLDGIGAAAADYDPGFGFDTDAAVGARGDTQENSFIGLIDEVEVFKRALSADEVKGIYDSQK
jgi:hypothetical protein